MSDCVKDKALKQAKTALQAQAQAFAKADPHEPEALRLQRQTRARDLVANALLEIEYALAPRPWWHRFLAALGFGGRHAR